MSSLLASFSRLIDSAVGIHAMYYNRSREVLYVYVADRRVKTSDAGLRSFDCKQRLCAEDERLHLTI